MLVTMNFVACLKTLNKQAPQTHDDSSRRSGGLAQGILEVYCHLIYSRCVAARVCME